MSLSSEIAEDDLTVESDGYECSGFNDYEEYLLERKSEFTKRYCQPVKTSYTIRDFDVLRTIGMGSFSRVVLAREKSRGTFHALKVMFKEEIVRLSAQRYVLRERNILRAISFPFVVHLQTTFQDNSYLYMVMPFFSSGDLFSQIRAKQNFIEPASRFYIGQIVLALEYLHYLGLVYRDLKPENVLLDTRGYVKLTDFGFCKQLSGRTYTFCGTPEYMAPEVVLGKGYGRGVDWWSLGVVTFEMVSGRVPFQSLSETDLYRKITTDQPHPMPNYFSSPLRDFVSGLLEKDTTRRLGCLKDGALQVKEHPWLRGLEWDGLLERWLMAPFVPEAGVPGDTSHFEDYPDFLLLQSNSDKYRSLFKGF